MHDSQQIECGPIPACDVVVSDEVSKIGKLMTADNVIPIPGTHVVGQLLICAERGAIKRLQSLIDQRLDSFGLCEIVRRVIVEAIIANAQWLSHSVMSQNLREAEEILLIGHINESVEAKDIQLIGDFIQ